LEKVWEIISTSQAHPDFDIMEEEILTLIKSLINAQTPIVSKLTKGEEKSLLIRDQVYRHMDGKINIASLAEQHNISEKTLQNSFKSLFGFTPNLFLRQMKLNLVHYELKVNNAHDITVSGVARKWGFTHMGRFSHYYTQLFGENPSETLKKTKELHNGITTRCVVRQEELY
jgi:AraC family ethanolamine operon transcriptional activator